eukprot:2908961-Prymnesium_polylepis.1
MVACSSRLTAGPGASLNNSQLAHCSTNAYNLKPCGGSQLTTQSAFSASVRSKKQCTSHV